MSHNQQPTKKSLRLQGLPPEIPIPTQTLSQIMNQNWPDHNNSNQNYDQMGNVPDATLQHQYAGQSQQQMMSNDPESLQHTSESNKPISFHTGITNRYQIQSRSNTYHRVNQPVPKYLTI